MKVMMHEIIVLSIHSAFRYMYYHTRFRYAYALNANDSITDVYNL